MSLPSNLFDVAIAIFAVVGPALFWLQVVARIERLQREVDKLQRRESAPDSDVKRSKRRHNFDAVISSDALEYTPEPPVEETYDYRRPIAPKTSRDIH